MKLWIVYGDDHDYDAMSQWLVGVYTTKEKAREAAEADKALYGKINGARNKYRANYTITPCEVDGVVFDDEVEYA